MRQLCEQTGVAPGRLPLLWDTDFLLGLREADGPERFVLRKINMSSVAPYPPSVLAPLVQATCESLKIAREQRR